MTFDPRMAIRLAVLGLLVCIVQLAAVSQISIFGAAPDLAPLLVCAAGLLCGAYFGMTFGFCVGLFLDTALVQDLGISSLLLVAVGYGAGRLCETVPDPTNALLPLALGTAASLVFSAGYVLLLFLLGADVPVSLALLRQIVLTVLVNALLALPVHALTRRVLEPVLPEDPRGGRRRGGRRRERSSVPGGPLSPLSRAS